MQPVFYLGAQLVADSPLFRALLAPGRNEVSRQPRVTE